MVEHGRLTLRHPTIDRTWRGLPEVDRGKMSATLLYQLLAVSCVIAHGDPEERGSSTVEVAVPEGESLVCRRGDQSLGRWRVHWSRSLLVRADHQLEGVCRAASQAHTTPGPTDGYKAIAHEHLETGPSSEPKMRRAEDCPAPQTGGRGRRRQHAGSRTRVLQKSQLLHSAGRTGGSLIPAAAEILLCLALAAGGWPQGAGTAKCWRRPAYAPYQSEPKPLVPSAAQRLPACAWIRAVSEQIVLPGIRGVCVSLQTRAGPDRMCRCPRRLPISH